jgi:hypothetical protein
MEILAIMVVLVIQEEILAAMVVQATLVMEILALMEVLVIQEEILAAMVIQATLVMAELLAVIVVAQVI